MLRSFLALLIISLAAVFQAADTHAAPPAPADVQAGKKTPATPGDRDGAKQKQAAEPAGKLLFDGKTLKGWSVVKKFSFKDHGKVTIKDGAIDLPAGQPATGIVFAGQMPRDNYRLTFEAKRIAGADFFCGLTFPVAKEYCTLILGGWGGTTVGLSNIDGDAAVENETTEFINFKKNTWYKVALTVDGKKIAATLDGEYLLETKRENHKFSIWWEQEPLQPLGICSWNTHGAIRNLRLEKIKVLKTVKD